MLKLVIGFIIGIFIMGAILTSRSVYEKVKKQSLDKGYTIKEAEDTAKNSAGGVGGFLLMIALFAIVFLCWL